MEGDEGEAKLQAAANWRDSALFSGRSGWRSIMPSA
jgi:hypothetical protein